LSDKALLSGADKVEELLRTYFLITSGPDVLETARATSTNPDASTLTITAPHTVQYLGDIAGLGNRAVRSVKPFPTLHAPGSLPAHLLSRFVKAMNCFRPPVPIPTMTNAGFPSMAELMDPAWLAVSNQPFSIPWMTKAGAWDVAPRFVAYYEVSIRDRPVGRPAPPDGTTANNCVAVGLANAEFPLEGLMPGWDSRSYAYHR